MRLGYILGTRRCSCLRLVCFVGVGGGRRGEARSELAFDEMEAHVEAEFAEADEFVALGMAWVLFLKEAYIGIMSDQIGVDRCDIFAQATEGVWVADDA